jgi:chaperonin GroES
VARGVASASRVFVGSGLARAIVPLVLQDPHRLDVSLEPLDEYLVIQPSNDETETRAGLILPASAAQAAACRTGIVTAIGTDVTGVEPGDKVLYPRDAGYEVRLGGIEVKVVKRDELIARVHD